MRILRIVLLIITIFGSLNLINAQEFKYEIPMRIENDWEVENIYDSNVKVDSLFMLIKKIENK